MQAFLAAAHEFLAHRRLAVAGLSHDQPNAGNYVYRRLREAGYDVFAVHPTASTIEGGCCYHSIGDIPGGVDGVVIATHPSISADVVRDCIEHNVHRVWLHRSIGAGSVSADAVALCEQHGIAVLDGGCPNMVLKPDVAHRCMRWVLSHRGRLPAGQRYRAEAGAH